MRWCISDRDPWQYLFFSFQTFTCFKTGPRLETTWGVWLLLVTPPTVEWLCWISLSFTQLLSQSLHCKNKVIPVTGRGGPYCCEMSRLPHFLDNRLTDGGEVVSLTRWPAGRPLSPGRFLVLISVRGWADPKTIVRLEGIGQLKNSMTARIEPATFRLTVPNKLPAVISADEGPMSPWRSDTSSAIAHAYGGFTSAASYKTHRLLWPQMYEKQSIVSK
jgi:hypothetical protein